VPWAISFTDEYANRVVGTPLNIPLHPTQVYESVACLLIFFILVAIAARKKFHGQVALAYVVLYAIARFIIEFYRGDVARGAILDGAISTSQFIAILMVLGAALLGPYAYKKHRLPSATAPAPAA
jgi:phosphatidylglycerol:prolipoprotein diacylglycerol transferase